MSETNVGSPKGRESYGDTVPVVVAGVTTCQGGREGRPQGEGAQVIGHQRPGGMRNAKRRSGTGCPPRTRWEGPAVQRAVSTNVQPVAVPVGLWAHLLQCGGDDSGAYTGNRGRHVHGKDRGDH